MTGLLLLAALAAPSQAQYEKLHEACRKGTPEVKAAACPILESIEEFTEAKQELSVFADKLEAALARLQALEPGTPPVGDVHFGVYDARRADVSRAFLASDDYDGLKRVRAKAEWVYVALRELLLKGHDEAKDLAERLVKAEKKVAASDDGLGSLDDELEAIKDESVRDAMKKHIREVRRVVEAELAAERKIDETTDKTLAKLATLRFFFDTEHLSAMSKLGLIHYSNNLKDLPARQAYVASVEKNEVPTLREHRTAFFDAGAAALEALK